MKVSIGATVLAAGTAGNEPARLVGYTGTREVVVRRPIRAPKARLLDRGGRAYRDTVDADYSYDTAALAQAALLSKRIAALSATGSLIYGDGEAAVTVGPALVESVQLAEWTGAGFTLRFEIQAVETL